MKKEMVITILSEDRPGIVERVTDVLLRYGANLEESRMARLGGEFAGIMLITVDESKMDDLTRAMDALKEQSLSVIAKATDPSVAKRYAGYVPYEIKVSGADHEGIVHGIAEYLAAQGANIEELSTDVTNAPITGIPLFSMRAVVEVPPKISTTELREKLAYIAEEQGVDIEIKLLVK